ncbi:hypothetical protein BC936DRAFT_146515 [Jimgerdemannia flammicorona]|uniref:Zn(2)-C6 fungal-type domain-containing protein n=1 Tax=Jimgerdemannia flammicorona TaxID=994334 RepID=A0A433D7F1_9FUNG|nr:hypothetical protein BC936DRAFT_146515 [Jimgerdemannia flammicorona]
MDGKTPRIRKSTVDGRTSRACDSCSLSHKRCDGRDPCWQCSTTGHICSYNRRQARPHPTY